MMRTKTLMLFAVLTLCATTGQAQEETRKSFFSINVGANAGSMTEKLLKELTTTYKNGDKEKEEKGYDLDYKTISYCAAVDFQLDGFITMFECRYTKATYDTFSDYTDEKWLKLDPLMFQDQNLYEGAFYFGAVINAKHRLNIPIMGGVNLCYVDGYPLKDLCVDFAYKARIKYYITDEISIYAGITGSYGGCKTDDEYDAEGYKGTGSNIDVTLKRLTFEAGLTLLLGRKGGKTGQKTVITKEQDF